jgi:formate hydrogenlyase transcriptional activator
MESFSVIFGLITAGVSLAMGLVCLSASLHKDADKADLVFGFMCLSVFIYFILPPAGFIVIDKAPYPLQIIEKRAFNFINGALFPWFILLYSGYGKKIIAFITDIFYLVGFLLMAFTFNDSMQPQWVSFVLIPIGITLVYGTLAVRFLLKSGNKNKGYWFLGAMAIFALCYLLTVSNQFMANYFGRMLHAKIFYPINLYILPFMLIMGVRLRADAFKKSALEKLLLKRDIRWQSLLEHMQLIVLELDTAGKISYINPYGVRILGHSSPKELLTKDWFSGYLPIHEALVTKSVFEQAIVQRKEVPYYKNDVLTTSNKWIPVSWTNVFVYDDLGTVNGVLSIGSNISNEENAYKEIAELKAALEKENLILKGQPLDGIVNGEIVGKGPSIGYAVEKARQVAESTAIVLLEGETGVGKELFANLIHSLSLRSKMPLIKVNCGALPAELIEDELFGHEKGAFTGAIQPRKGRFELADHGTIFLDEIGELPLALQPKLLRVLQNGEFERIGGQQTIRVDVRVISATNKDLEKETQNGRFREDLYYRLNVFPITIPPLRSRKEDIPLLVTYFKEKKAIKHNKVIENISKADLNRLCSYSWPGNIRELKNVIERAVISSTTTTLKLDWWGHPAAADNGLNPVQSVVSLEKIEKNHILRILNECNWKINGDNGAAEKLSMHPNTLRSRMKKLNLTRSAH